MLDTGTRAARRERGGGRRRGRVQSVGRGAPWAACFLYQQVLLELDRDTAAGGVFNGLLGLFADEVFLETVNEG